MIAPELLGGDKIFLIQLSRSLFLYIRITGRLYFLDKTRPRMTSRKIRIELGVEILFFTLQGLTTDLMRSKEMKECRQKCCSLALVPKKKTTLTRFCVIMDEV